MTFEPITYHLDVDAIGHDEVSEAFGVGSFALALRSGRLVATVVSKKTGKHVTVQLRAKRREGKRFRTCGLDVAERIYLDVPSSDRGGGSEIGILHLVGKWAGKILPPWEAEFDRARVWAARRVFDVAAGLAPVSDEQAEILEGKICLMCGRELTDPESIARNIGPECWRKATSAEPRAGGAHQRRGEQQALPTEEEVIARDARNAEEEHAELHMGRTPAHPEFGNIDRNGKRIIDVDDEEGNAEDAAVRFEIADGATASEALQAFAEQGGLDELSELGAEVRGDARREEAREAIEAEIQETIKEPTGEELDMLPDPPPAVPEGMVLLRAGEDPRTVLEEAAS